MGNFITSIPDIYSRGISIENIEVLTFISDKPTYRFYVNGKKYLMKKDFYDYWEFDDRCGELPLDQLRLLECYL